MALYRSRNVSLRLSSPCSASENGDGLPAESPEWPSTLNVEALIAEGWRPTPLRQFLIKMHSRCNLACDYCYVYTLADQTWRTKPRTIAPEIVSIVAERIAEHARTHGLDDVRVIFHGGEPLLTGASPLVAALGKIRAAVGGRVRVEASVQTNGTLISDETLDVFEQSCIRVGVSLDGGADTHDQHRRYINGRGSYADVTRALQRLIKHPAIYAGVLTTVNLRADPLLAYEALLDLAPPAVNFLLPHGNWSSPPPGRSDPAAAPYATWLIAVFDRWYGASSRETRIRLFEEIIHLLLGGGSASEAIGLTPSSLVVIETDGSIEQSDALKSAYHQAAATGLNVARDSFDEVLRLPQIAARQIGLEALGDECKECSLARICGGGLYPHRYRAGNGFRNRSVYCSDLYALITHIRTRISEDLHHDYHSGQNSGVSSMPSSSRSPAAAALTSGCPLPSRSR